MNISEITEQIANLEKLLEAKAKMCAEQSEAAALSDSPDACAAEGWFRDDVTRYKNAAHDMRNALSRLGRS